MPTMPIFMATGAQPRAQRKSGQPRAGRLKPGRGRAEIASVKRSLPCLLLVLAAVATGCGATIEPATPATPAAASAKKARKHVRVVPKARFVRRANAVCRRFTTSYDRTGGLGTYVRRSRSLHRA